MQFITLSVRSLFILGITAFLFAFTKWSPSTATSTMLEGKWDCGSRSGQLDEYTSYQLQCGGDVCFKADHTVESTTTDAFLPTGSKWQVENDKLVLRDSYGSKFVDFEIKRLGSKELVLSRKGIEYGFVRIN